MVGSNGCQRLDQLVNWIQADPSWIQQWLKAFSRRPHCCCASLCKPCDLCCSFFMADSSGWVERCTIPIYRHSCQARAAAPRPAYWHSKLKLRSRNESLKISLGFNLKAYTCSKTKSKSACQFYKISLWSSEMAILVLVFILTGDTSQLHTVYFILHILSLTWPSMSDHFHFS